MFSPGERDAYAGSDAFDTLEYMCVPPGERTSYEDALRNADSLNDLRLEIKLHGKEAKNRNVFSGIGNLDIVPDATTQNTF